MSPTHHAPRRSVLAPQARLDDGLLRYVCGTKDMTQPVLATQRAGNYGWDSAGRIHEFIVRGGGSRDSEYDAIPRGGGFESRRRRIVIFPLSGASWGTARGDLGSRRWLLYSTAPALSAIKGSRHHPPLFLAARAATETAAGDCPRRRLGPAGIGLACGSPDPHRAGLVPRRAPLALMPVLFRWVSRLASSMTEI